MAKIEEIAEEHRQPEPKKQEPAPPKEVAKKEGEAAPAEEEEDPLKAFEQAMKDVPLLMTPETMPKNLEDNPHLMAIQALLYDGTPEEIAENFKNQGNEAFHSGKVRYRDALEFYNKGLEQSCSDKLKSILHSNRAAVHIENKNYRMATEDCVNALKFDNTNLKAHFRLTRAHHALEKFDEALKQCREGLKIDPKSMALLGEEEKLVKKIAEKERKDRERRERWERERAMRKAVDQAIKARGIKEESSKPKRTEEDEEGESRVEAEVEYQVEVDEQGALTWPVLFSYPEHRTTDLIARFAEEDRLIDHFHEMFQERPEWDPEGKYRPESLAAYFEARTQGGRVALAKVPPEVPLRKILSNPNHVVRDRIPGFFVVVKGSPFERQFIDSYKKL